MKLKIENLSKFLKLCSLALVCNYLLVYANKIFAYIQV